MADDAGGVVPGQRYRVAGNRYSLWRVEEVARYPGQALLHVRLCRVGAEHDRKTVALGVLRDRRYYELDEEEASGNR